MGQLVDGNWHTDTTGFASDDGAFHRKPSTFRDWVTADGSEGPDGAPGHKAETGRYHLYVSMACPWAHRTLIFRALKGLADHIGVSVVSPLMGKDGWTFEGDFPGIVGDPIHGAHHLREVYLAADPKMSGRVTVPILWDKQRGTIVSNESAEIIRMFNSAFNGITGNHADFYPADLRGEIDAVNERVYDTLNNGVYRAGFATTQDAYKAAVAPLFDTLDWLEERLNRQRYVAGDRLTEADWRLFPTLVRFDPVYHGHFKCNRARIADYPNLLGYMRELAQIPGIMETIDLVHIKHHYYRSHPSVNPTGIVPVGMGPDLMAPHGRAMRRAA